MDIYIYIIVFILIWLVMDTIFKLFSCPCKLQVDVLSKNMKHHSWIWMGILEMLQQEMGIILSQEKELQVDDTHQSCPKVVLGS